MGVEPGGRAGIGFVDLERGWTLNDEDLSGAGITLISGINQDYQGHGTAVLGEVVAVDNTRGGIGIAPRARARVVSQWRTSTSYSTAAAIASAVAVMSRGDVLLLEAQTTVGTQVKIPVETEQAAYDAIVAAVAAGIVVVEAAGNGGLDLDMSTLIRLASGCSIPAARTTATRVPSWSGPPPRPPRTAG